jgi:hypothetical protein
VIVTCIACVEMRYPLRIPFMNYWPCYLPLWCAKISGSVEPGFSEACFWFSWKKASMWTVAPTSKQRRPKIASWKIVSVNLIEVIPDDIQCNAFKFWLWNQNIPPKAFHDWFFFIFVILCLPVIGLSKWKAWYSELRSQWTLRNITYQLPANELVIS